MRKLFLFLFLLPLTGKAQSPARVISGDTLDWNRFVAKQSAEMNLENLIQTSHDFHFRYWRNGQVLETWRTDKNNYNGLIINYTEYFAAPDKKNGEKKPGQMVTEITPLDTADARFLAEWSEKITSIPPKSDIPGWQYCIDGTSYMFEISTSSSWVFKSYGCPEAHKNMLPEAAHMMQFIDTVYSRLDLYNRRQLFYSSLPPGTYSSNGWTFITTPTAKQQAIYKKRKPYFDYHDSIRDTLNHFLVNELTRVLQMRGDSLPHYRSYHILFSKHNRVRKITAIEPFRTASSRQQFRREKRIIRKAMRRIPLDFVHSPYWYQKEIMITDERIIVF